MNVSQSLITVNNWLVKYRVVRIFSIYSVLIIGFLGILFKLGILWLFFYLMRFWLWKENAVEV